MSKVGGFTLIEALVVVGISVILVATSLPTFLDTIERYQIRTQADRFLSIIKLARVTAIENVKRVRICPSTNQGTSLSAYTEKGVLSTHFHATSRRS